MADSPFGSLRSRGSPGHASPGDRNQSSDESNRSGGHLTPFNSPGSGAQRRGLVSGYSSDQDLENLPPGLANGGISPTPFVTKLYQMVNDPKSHPSIAWKELGTSFVVTDESEFTKNVLIFHFNYTRNDFIRFVRQLKRYGFEINKTRGQHTSTSPRTWEFTHPQFLRDRPDLLERVKRQKVPLTESDALLFSPPSGSISPSSSVSPSRHPSPDPHTRPSPLANSHTLPLPSFLADSQPTLSPDTSLPAPPSPILFGEIPPLWRKTGFEQSLSNDSSLSDLAQSLGLLDIITTDNNGHGETECQITEVDKNTLSPDALQVTR